MIQQYQLIQNNLKRENDDGDRENTFSKEPQAEEMKKCLQLCYELISSKVKEEGRILESLSKILEAGKMDGEKEKENVEANQEKSHWSFNEDADAPGTVKSNYDSIESASCQSHESSLGEVYKNIYSSLMEERGHLEITKARCKQLEKTNICLTENNDKMKSEIANYNELLDQANGAIIALKHKLAAAETILPRSEKLKSRLTAAHQTMTKQRIHTEEMQAQLEEKFQELIKTRSKLARSEAVSANRQAAIDKLRFDLARLENEVKKLKEENECLRNNIETAEHFLGQSRSLLTRLRDENMALGTEIAEQETCLNKHIMDLEKKVTELKKKLLQKDVDAEQLDQKIKEKLHLTQKTLCDQVEIASSKLIKSDSKIKELYTSLEILITKIHESQSASENDQMKCAMKDEAVKVASTILKVDPAEVHEILENNCENKVKLKHWLCICQNLIHKEVFANDLAYFLFDVIAGTPSEIAIDGGADSCEANKFDSIFREK